MFIKFSNNPCGRNGVGDCVLRALGRVLEKSWNEVYWDLCFYGAYMCDWGNSNAVWDAYLIDKGFKRAAIPNVCPECYTVEDFARDNPVGRFIVATGTHTVAVIDGDIWDSWNSSHEIITYYYYRSEF
jgi:hypothetical protein